MKMKKFTSVIVTVVGLFVVLSVSIVISGPANAQPSGVVGKWCPDPVNNPG